MGGARGAQPGGTALLDAEGPARCLEGCGLRWKSAGSGRDTRRQAYRRGVRGRGFANAAGGSAGGRDARPGGFRGFRVSSGSQGAR